MRSQLSGDLRSPPASNVGMIDAIDALPYPEQTMRAKGRYNDKAV